jgi:Xaa-Pro aminopeptidase
VSSSFRGRDARRLDVTVATVPSEAEATVTTRAHWIPNQVVEDRICALQSWLAEHDFAAYAVTGTENAAYLSGWRPDVEPWERPIVMLVPRRGAATLVLHELSVHGVRMARDRGTLVVDDVAFYVERPTPAGGARSRSDWGALVAERLSALGLPADARIACDAKPRYLDEVAGEAPDLRWTVAPQPLVDARAVKSADELALMRAAAALTDYGQTVFRELARPGELMAEVDAETVRRMRVEGARRLPGSDVTARCFSLTGPASAAPHGTGAGSDARIERGHGIVNIIIASLGGYHVENERTLFVGDPNPEQRRAYACAFEAQAAAVAACRPGEPIAGIDRAALAVIERHGFAEHVFHRAGHGIGLRGHDLPEDMAFNERPLRAGEVYTIEPGIYLWGVGGFRIDDTVVVADPPELLTSTPRGLDDVTLPG